MGLGDYVEDRIRFGLSKGIDDTLPKVQGMVDESLGKTRAHVNDMVTQVEGRSDEFLDRLQERLRTATDLFFTDLGRHWEKRLESETRAQFKLLNRVLIYTLAVGLFSFGYAWLKMKIGF